MQDGEAECLALLNLTFIVILAAMFDLFTQLDWATFLLAMVFVELTPGPNMGWLAALSAQHGRKMGLMAVLGVTIGLAVQVIAAATGLATLISYAPVVYQLIRWAGIVFMVWLAWEAFSESGLSSPSKELPSKGFTRGFIANILNPKALVFYVAVVGQFTSPALGSLWWQILILGGLHLIIATIVHVAIVMIGASFGAAFEQWRTSLAARLFFAGSLLAIAAWIAVSTG